MRRSAALSPRITTSSPATVSRACRSCRARWGTRSSAIRSVSPGRGLGDDTAIAPNGADGVLIASSSSAAASSNVIGGATSGAGNLISDNLGNGVHITGAGSTENLVEENYIGIGPGGGFLFGQGDETWESRERRLDRECPRQHHRRLECRSEERHFGQQGRWRRDYRGLGHRQLRSEQVIGLTAGGASVQGNSGEGVAIFSASNVVGPGNVISGNLRGVLISGPAATGNQVTGNLIGTDSNGQADLGNAREGVRIENASNNSIVGDGSGSQVISGNNDGVSIIATVGSTASGNSVQGNLIGTDKAGTLVLGNSLSGVLIDSAAGNTIGGTSAATRNLISANNYGLTITGATATNNLVQGNFIGTDITGTLPLGNELDGVLITQSASSNSIGGYSDRGGQYDRVQPRQRSQRGRSGDGQFDPART